MKKQFEKIKKVRKGKDISGYTVVFDPNVHELENDPRFETMEIRADFYVTGKIITDGARANIDVFVESLYGKTLLVSDTENGDNIGFIEIMSLNFHPKKKKPIH